MARKTDCDAFTQMMMLGLESQAVIWMRLMMFAAGGPKAQAEANLMVSEKIAAGMDAATRLAWGASPASIVTGYRRKVRANVRRLSR